MSQISATDPNVEEYWFFCQKWFDADKGDRQIVRELLPTDARGNILSDRQGKQNCSFIIDSVTVGFPRGPI